MFASAYMGRKRRGRSPTIAFDPINRKSGLVRQTTNPCDHHFSVTKLLPMKFAMSNTLKLTVAILVLFLTTESVQAQDWAKTRLDASPRHHEYVALKHGDRTLQAFVVYPEVKTKAPVVVLIHEIFGLSDWAKEMADELAAKGFIVIAPDLLSGFGPNGGGSSEFPDQDAAVKAVSGLNPDTVMADLDAAADYGKHLPAANGKIAVIGFCWGGGKSFAFAAHRKDLSAAFVFYGTAPADVAQRALKVTICLRPERWPQAPATRRRPLQPAAVKPRARKRDWRCRSRRGRSSTPGPACRRPSCRRRW